MLPLIAAGIAAAAPSIIKALTKKDAQVLPQMDPYQGQQLGFADAWGQQYQNQQQMRGQQLDFINALQQQALGQGHAAQLAQAQLQNNVNQANAATASQIASARGLSPAAAIRMAAQQNAMANQAGVAGAQANRLQGQLAAQGMLGNALSGVRGQDLSGVSMAGQGSLAQSAQNAANYYNAANLNQRAALANDASSDEDRRELMGGISGAAGGFAKMLSMQQGSGGGSQGAAAMAHGGSVEVDSRFEDRVPVMLQEGETVIPASLQGKDKQDFLEAYDAMQGGSSPGRPVSPDAFLKALAARDATIERRIQRLEELIMRGGR